MNMSHKKERGTINLGEKPMSAQDLLHHANRNIEVAQNKGNVEKGALYDEAARGYELAGNILRRKGRFGAAQKAYVQSHEFHNLAKFFDPRRSTQVKPEKIMATNSARFFKLGGYLASRKAKQGGQDGMVLRDLDAKLLLIKQGGINDELSREREILGDMVYDLDSIHDPSSRSRYAGKVSSVISDAMKMYPSGSRAYANLREILKRAEEKVDVEGLEHRVGISSVLTIVVGLFLLSANFLNYSVQLSPGTFSPISWKFWLGIILILIGLVAGFFWFKNKKANSIPIKEISIKPKRKIKKK